MLADLLIGGRFLLHLPRALRHPLQQEEAERILQRRLAGRDASFLALVRRAIYAYPDGVYGRLLGAAGCRYGDLEGLVRREGVEGALRVLYRHGVYLSGDEFKGRVAIVRGSLTIPPSPRAFWNPLSTIHAFLQTSGRGGSGTPVPLSLQSIRDGAVAYRLVLHARRGSAWRQALWWVPGGTALNRLLTLGVVGITPERWFSPVDPDSTELHPRYRWSASLARWGGRVAGVSFPRCEHVPLTGPLPIARWMAETLRAGAVPSLSTFPGAAVRLAEAAGQAGLDLAGASVSLVGEPMTAARLATLRGMGLHVFHGYGSVDSGGIAWGCLQPVSPDDSHVQHDRHALIQPGDAGGDRALPPRTLLLSSLWVTAPLVLLNVSLGDEGVLESRSCGCPLERLGWTMHLHRIRSFEKLTAASTNLLDHDVIRVLEETLPRRFGGGPTHYQLVEDEATGGAPRLRLLVHPDVGPVDSTAVAEAFLAGVGQGAGAERLTRLLWSDGRLLTVERRPPVSTRSGKILHVLSGHGVVPPGETAP